MIVVSQDGKKVFPLEQVMLEVEKGWGRGKHKIVLFHLGGNPLTEDPIVIAEFRKEEDADNALMDLLSSYQRDAKVFVFGVYKEQK